MAGFGTAVVDFGSTATSNEVYLAITGQTGIVSASQVEAWTRGQASLDHTVDEHFLEDLQVFAGDIVFDTGFTIRVRPREGMVYGKYNIDWCWA